MTTTIEELYFDWLCKKIDVEFGHHTEHTYYGLFKKLHETDFAWTIHNDGNRASDGLDQRLYFRREMGLQDRDLYTREIKGASMLEVIIGLSVRLAFLADGREQFWAWQLIENIGLHKMRDPITPKKSRYIDETLEAVLFRQYGRDGVGGFFPLAWADNDQRKVELWYQMAAYVLEMHDP